MLPMLIDIFFFIFVIVGLSHYLDKSNDKTLTNQNQMDLTNDQMTKSLPQ